MPPEPSSGEVRRFYVPNSTSTVSLSSGTNEDEPEGAGVPQPLPLEGNPSPAIVRAYSAIVCGLLGVLHAEADRLMATAPSDPAPERYLERLEEFGKHAHREGAKAKRLCAKAVRLSRRAQR